MTVFRLGHDQRLISELKTDTIRIISVCDSIEPIKKLVVCHDILSLTLDLRERFKNVFEEAADVNEKQLHLDRSALLELRRQTSELFVYHGTFLPCPTFNPHYVSKVRRLLSLYGFPAPSGSGSDDRHGGSNLPDCS